MVRLKARIDTRELLMIVEWCCCCDVNGKEGKEEQSWGLETSMAWNRTNPLVATFQLSSCFCRNDGKGRHLADVRSLSGKPRYQRTKLGTCSWANSFERSPKPWAVWRNHCRWQNVWQTSMTGRIVDAGKLLLETWTCTALDMASRRV